MKQYKVRDVMTFGVVCATIDSRRSRGPVIPFVHRRQRTKSSRRVAGDLLATSAVTVQENASTAEAARLLVQHRIRRLPVVNAAGQLVGIVSAHDLLKVFLRSDATSGVPASQPNEGTAEPRRSPRSARSGV